MSQTPEELEILAGMVDSVNRFDRVLNSQMEKAPIVNGGVESNRLDKRQMLTQLNQHGRPDAEREIPASHIPHPVEGRHNAPQYSPNPNDGFGEDLGNFGNPRPQQAQPLVAPRQQFPVAPSFEGNSLLPPSILTSILRKLISIETTVNKIVDKQTSTDKKGK